jgi:hypothetical protein
VIESSNVCLVHRFYECGALSHDAITELFDEVLAIANHNEWLSGEHFSFDGSDDDTGNFKNKKRSNDTHESTTDADGRLHRKGKTASELHFMGHTPSDNRHGLITLVGAHKGYDAAEFIEVLTEMKVSPQAAQNTSNRKSAVPYHIAATDGYAISQQRRKLIEQGFGWTKFIGPIRQVMLCGLKRVAPLFVLTMAAHNVTRMRTLEKIRLQTT